LDLKGSLHITYEKTDNKSNEVTIDIPKEATSTGSCQDEFLILTFKDVNSTQFNVTWRFESTKDTFSVSNLTVQFEFTNKSFPDAKGSVKPVNAFLKNEVDYLKADLGHSLKCKDDKSVTFDDGSVTKGVDLKIDDIQFQAFMNSTDGKFGDEENCVSSKSRDIVPIAVGCALVALVVIVLIAYLIGRRRSRQAGYQSV
jgi:lysosomal-associated membrane protein 1/2